MNTIVVALVVQNCLAGEYEKNLESTCNFISLAIEKGARIIIFPEMNLTGYVANDDILTVSRSATEDMLNLFKNMAKNSKSTILVGLAEKTWDKRIYASHFVFNADGSFDIYRKIHTSPFEKKIFQQAIKYPYLTPMT